METHICSRCKRLRRAKFVVQRKTLRGKLQWRCRARSVCASKARRLRDTKNTKGASHDA